MCTNAFVSVNPDEVVVVEQFGRFSHVAEAGCHCLGLDVCGGCITTHKACCRAFEVEAETELVFDKYIIINLRLTAQISIAPSRAYAAVYRLQDPKGQIASYMKDIARGAFCHGKGCCKARGLEAKKEMIKDNLQDAIFDCGYEVHAVQVFFLYPNDTPQWVRNASQALAEAELERKAAIEKAQGHYNYKVFQAKAARDCKALQGEGAARQLIAIAEGLKRDLGDQPSSTSAMLELLLMIQHFDALEKISQENTTIMMPLDLGYVARLAHDLRSFASSQSSSAYGPPKQMVMDRKARKAAGGAGDHALQKVIKLKDAKLKQSFAPVFGQPHYHAKSLKVGAPQPVGD